MNFHSIINRILFSLRLEEMFESYHKQLKEDVTETLSQESSSGKKEENDIAELVSQIKFCLQPAVRSHITVYNLNSNTSLSEAIFQSICRCKLIQFI